MTLEEEIEKVREIARNDGQWSALKPIQVRHLLDFHDRLIETLRVITTARTAEYMVSLAKDALVYLEVPTE